MGIIQTLLRRFWYKDPLDRVLRQYGDVMDFYLCQKNCESPDRRIVATPKHAPVLKCSHCGGPMKRRNFGRPSKAQQKDMDSLEVESNGARLGFSQEQIARHLEAQRVISEAIREQSRKRRQ